MSLDFNHVLAYVPGTLLFKIDNQINFVIGILLNE